MSPTTHPTCVWTTTDTEILTLLIYGLGCVFSLMGYLSLLQYDGYPFPEIVGRSLLWPASLVRGIIVAFLDIITGK